MDTYQRVTYAGKRFQGKVRSQGAGGNVRWEESRGAKVTALGARGVGKVWSQGTRGVGNVEVTGLETGCKGGWNG